MLIVQFAVGVKMAVKGGERPYAVARRLELSPGLRLANSAGLKVQKACDHLEVVLYPVMNFLHQELLLVDRRRKATLLPVQHERRPLE